MGSENGASKEVDVYKALLESTNAIPWRIDWGTGQFTYVGPQIEKLLGWTPDSWGTVQDWATRMHPDDQKWVPDFCVAQSKAGIDHEADYRALNSSGGYVWIRDVVHVVRRDDGSVEALVGFMFDISERKRTEEELRRLQRELEDLSFKDGLTGIANRRRFDSLGEREWESARRSQRPLSLLLFDIDFFKQYNDHYGHIAGDDCLKRVAQALGTGARRPRDILARYGGEEFALVLPETDAGGAEAVARLCGEAVAREQLTHARSSVASHVTVSVGVGTAVPAPGQEWLRFIDAVDQRLLRAKQGGRNRSVTA
ncbi:MAG TPA: sensor domain-containing diguanylate cyclase [Polyangia bacterium]|nr:sensor domain-containing diguanylate cyclase [Polyangia bacterium]